VFWQCIGVILNQQGLETHPEDEEAVGCPLDFCFNRDDIKVGLKKMRFDHEDCRSQIEDAGLLKAIDRLLKLELPKDRLVAGTK
jgi:hypothetical protein